MAKQTYFYARMRMPSGAEHLVYLDGHELGTDAPTAEDFDHSCLIADKIIADGQMSDWWWNQPYGPMIGTHTDDGTVVRINRHLIESYTIVVRDMYLRHRVGT